MIIALENTVLSNINSSNENNDSDPPRILWRWCLFCWIFKEKIYREVTTRVNFFAKFRVFVTILRDHFKDLGFNNAIFDIVNQSNSVRIQSYTLIPINCYTFRCIK
jgi:hypothetical protein